MTTYEIQPLPAPELAWVVDDDATLVEVTHPNVPNRLISAFDLFSFQLWTHSSDDRLVVRNKLYADEPVLELSEFLSTHREATLHVRTLSGDAYHTFTVFLFDALCCGSFAHWSIKGLLESLGIEKSTSEFNRQRTRWRRAGLQYELKDVETSHTSDTVVMKHKPGCTEMVIFLLARWSFSPMYGGGGCRKKEYRCACEALLRTLCKALHEGQTIMMPFSLRHDVKRHECGAIVGDDIVFLSVQQDGIVDLQELRARAPSNDTAQLWLKHLDLKFGCEKIDLVDLLRWSVTSKLPYVRRTKFPMQVVWNIGRALDKLLLMNLNTERDSQVSPLRLECDLSPSAQNRCLWPLHVAISSQHTMQNQAPTQVPSLMPSLMQAGAEENATQRHTSRSQKAASLTNTSSEKISTARPAKKRARSKY